jgi:predicted branched-subunit amino acid permease
MKLHSNRRSYEKRKRLPQGEKTKNPKVMAASLASIVISAVIFCMVVVIGVIGLTSGEKVVSESTALETEGPFHIWFYWDDNEVFYGEDASFEMSAPMIIPGDVGYFPADGIATALGGLLGTFITFNTTGLDFALTALFVVLFMEQWKKKENRFAGVAGIVCAAVSLAVFGADRMVIAAMVLILLVLLGGRKRTCI